MAENTIANKNPTDVSDGIVKIKIHTSKILNHEMNWTRFRIRDFPNFAKKTHYTNVIHYWDVQPLGIQNIWLIN